MSDAPRSGRSLDPETLAAYVDGRLPPDERSRVEAELAADPDLYEWLVETMRAEAEIGERVPKVPAAPKLAEEHRASDGGPRVLPFYRRRAVIGVVGPVLAAAAALLLVVRLQPAWWQSMWGPSVDPRFEKLVAAVGEERYIEGRLTGGFKYGPLRSVTRGPGDLSTQNLALLAAAGELQKAAQADPSASNLHAWGVSQLLRGEWDEAIRNLERASTIRMNDPSLLSDLAAAYLARSKALGRIEDLQRALSSANRALDLSPRLREALFNRALAASAVGSESEATKSWEEVLAAEDSASEWASEVRQRLGRGPR